MDFDVRHNNRKRMKLDMKWALYVISFVGFLCVGMVARQMYWYYCLKDELCATGNRVELLKQQKQKLADEKAALERLDYVEKVARDNYNMVKKNEVPVFVVDEKERK